MARIISPAMDETISGQVKFIGVADVPNFVYYKMQYETDLQHIFDSANGTSSWGELYTSKTRVVDPGPLMEWFTWTVDPGVYWLRLIVADSTGNYPDPCEVRVNVVR